jgi:drug/metabolite transporter (DMT)-like permease
MPNNANALWGGIFFSLAAGMMWGLVFVGPLMLPEYPAALHTFGRYLAFGLIALPLAFVDRAEIKRLTREDWLTALKLAAIGNVLYYLFLSSAIQRAGGALPTMIIGTLPVVIAVAANLLNHQRDGRFPWLQLAPPLALILLGIACVNHVEWTALLQNPQADTGRYITGALLALGAVVCWTWYPLKNADWLRGHPDRNARVWATAQGLATLPLALLGYAAFWLWSSATNNPLPMPLGPRPLEFIGLMMAIALFASWLGTLCWNAASQRLPTALAGQLIVFETLAALAYAFWLRGHPDRNPRVWATAQGLATLPLALLGYAAFWLWSSATNNPMPMPLGPRPLEFIGLMMAIALFASWLGTLCWNAASQRLPTALAGQLIVFETLAALGYTFWLRGQWPEPVTLAGIALLVTGVMGGVRVKAVQHI